MQFVTGGAGGIGRATCQAFFDDGYRVAVTDIEADARAGLQAEIDSAGERVFGLLGDVASTESVDAMVAACGRAVRTAGLRSRTSRASSARDLGGAVGRRAGIA